jgi:nifR3 family TIM-barrel protein
MVLLDEKLGSCKDLSIGGQRLKGRALLAPMAGVTDRGMRRAAERFGAALTITEMVASDDYAAGATESRLRAQATGDGPHVMQLAGCDRHWMGEAARRAEAAGATIIDINMGCPAKRVTGGYAGSALMRDLDEALRLIAATVAAVRVPVTLKMRLGWDADHCNAPELARRAEAAGVCLVSVHGRTRSQFYQGRADWRAIAAVKRAVLAIPVVANGDCSGHEDAVAMLERSGADAVMVGRAAVGRPWIVGEIGYFIRHRRPRAPLPIALRLQCALEHYETLLAILGIAKGLRHARKHLSAYARYAGAEPELVHKLVTSEDPQAVRRMIAAAFLGDGSATRTDESRAMRGVGALAQNPEPIA